MTQDLIEQKTGWEPGGIHVKKALKGLTRAERGYVEAGYLRGDPRPATLQSLKRKGMFYLKITSPNGMCGFFVLTPLGVNVQALIRAHREGEGR